MWSNLSAETSEKTVEQVKEGGMDDVAVKKYHKTARSCVHFHLSHPNLDGVDICQKAAR